MARLTVYEVAPAVAVQVTPMYASPGSAAAYRTTDGSSTSLAPSDSFSTTAVNGGTVTFPPLTGSRFPETRSRTVEPEWPRGTASWWVRLLPYTLRVVLMPKR